MEMLALMQKKINQLEETVKFQQVQLDSVDKNMLEGNSIEDIPDFSEDELYEAVKTNTCCYCQSSLEYENEREGKLFTCTNCFKFETHLDNTICPNIDNMSEPIEEISQIN